MRREFWEHWKDSIILHMGKEAPELTLLEGTDPGDEKGVVRFALMRNGLILGIVFRPLRDAFDAFIGWSTTGKYPYAAARRSKFPSGVLDLSAKVLMAPWITIAGRSGAASWQFWEPREELIADPIAFTDEYVAFLARAEDVKELSSIIDPVVERAVSETVGVARSYFAKVIDFKAELPGTKSSHYRL
jgi:hypothetical protein